MDGLQCYNYYIKKLCSTRCNDGCHTQTFILSTEILDCSHQNPSLIDRCSYLFSKVWLDADELILVAIVIDPLRPVM